MANALRAGFVRREALLFEWRWETVAVGPSQQVGEAGGSLIREMPGRVGAAPTKPGRVRHCQMARVRRAGWRGVREEPASLRPSTLSPARTWRIWAGCGASPRAGDGAGNFRVGHDAALGRPWGRSAA